MCGSTCSTGSFICCIVVPLVMVFYALFVIMTATSTSSDKLDITDASLTQFNLTSNNTLLYYNFKVNVTTSNPDNNPNWRITAVASYKDNDFACVSSTPFDQGQENTILLGPGPGPGPLVFEGKKVIKLNPQQLAEYNEETRVGIYNDLAVTLDIRFIYKYKYKYGSVKYTYRSSIYECRSLRVPLISSGESAPTFNVTRCS